MLSQEHACLSAARRSNDDAEEMGGVILPAVEPRCMGHVGTEAGEEGEQNNVAFVLAAYEADAIQQNRRRISVHFVRKTGHFF